jgi:DNA-binding GntR family transcriptional regulator
VCVWLLKANAKMYTPQTVENNQIKKLQSLVEAHKQRINSYGDNLLVNRAREWIVRSLCSGNWGPGSKVSEAAVARELGMSRIPVRAAMDRLTQEGWIERIPNRGIFVRKLNEKEVEDLFFVREVLETAAVEQATKNVTDEQLRELKSVVEVYDASYEEQDWEVLRRADTHFHRLLMHFSGSVRLECIFESVLLQSNGPFFAITEFMPTHNGRLQELSVAHSELYEALAKRDAAKLKELLSEHIQLAKIRVLKILEYYQDVQQLRKKRNSR